MDKDNNQIDYFDFKKSKISDIFNIYKIKYRIFLFY